MSLDAFVIAENPSPSFGVSLDACVVAGNTFLSSLSFSGLLLGAPGLSTSCQVATLTLLEVSGLSTLSAPIEDVRLIDGLSRKHENWTLRMADWFSLRDSGIVQRPPFGEACVCVPLVVTGILSDCTNFSRFSAGGAEQMQGTAPNKATLHLGSQV